MAMDANPNEFLQYSDIPSIFSNMTYNFCTQLLFKIQFPQIFSLLISPFYNYFMYSYNSLELLLP